MIEDPFVDVTQYANVCICLRMTAGNWCCQKHEECVQGLENDFRKERASVTRAELNKVNAEQRICTLEAELVYLGAFTVLGR